MTGRKEPFLNFLRELVLEMMAQHGTPPHGKVKWSFYSIWFIFGIFFIHSRNGRNASVQHTVARFDRFDHWPVPTELDQKGQPRRRNCKQCSLDGKKDMKCVNLCEKCNVPLHHHCFKERIQSIFMFNFFKPFIYIFLIRRKNGFRYKWVKHLQFSSSILNFFSYIIESFERNITWNKSWNSKM